MTRVPASQGWQHSAALALSVAMQGCSLLGLGDFDIPTCAEQPGIPSKCLVLDERDGIANSACYHWQCRQSGPGCELKPKDSDGDRQPDARVCSGIDPSWKLDCDDTRPERGVGIPERCDGIDNDCDGVVDEEASERSATPSELGWIDVAGISGDHALELTPVLEGSDTQEPRPLLNLQSAGRAWLLDTSLMQATELHYDSAGAATDKPCPRIGMGGAVACNIRQLALSASTTSLLGAAVTDDIGCPNGELRVGIVSDLAAPRLFLGATRSDAPNNLAYGVDVSSGRRCPDGVSNPSIASLRSPSGEQALAVWLERSVDAVADSCADPTAVAVLRAIGVWVMPGTQPSVAGTGAGTSQEIGMSAGSARAAVTGFALGGAVRTGYITAFGNADGRLALIVSDALPARTAADTTALSMPEPQPFGAADHIDFVTLAVEPAAPDATELRFGAAYRAGCGDEQTVEIALFRLSISSSFQLENYSTVRITRPSATHIDGNSLRPIITYAADGFRAPDENGVAPGGFIVVFADDAADALRAVRISRDGDLLDTEPYRVEQGRFEAVAPIHEVGRRVSYVAVKRNTRDVVLGRLQCSVD